jgi:hypothetical protein
MAAAPAACAATFDVLPPGDIRNCMVALSEDSHLLSRLFQYRFPAGRGLKGHSFGNLFLMALTQIMGDFPGAVKVSSEVLKIAGRIYPSTTANVASKPRWPMARTWWAKRASAAAGRASKRVRLIPRKVRPLDATLSAIAEADAITLGPGSLFTSVIPNLLVEGFRRPSAGRGHQGVLREPDVAAGRNHGFSGVRPHPRHPAARGRQVPGLRRGQHPAHSLGGEEALRAERRRCRWRTTSTPFTRWG